VKVCVFDLCWERMDREEEACSDVGGFLGQNRNGAVAREKRGEQFRKGNWGFSSSIT